MLDIVNQGLRWVFIINVIKCLFFNSVEELDRLLDRCNATSILYDELLLIEASLDGFVDKRVGDAKLEWLEVLEEIARFCTEISQVAKLYMTFSKLGSV